MRKKLLTSCAVLFALSLGIAQQTNPITGKVVDDKGAPIPAASVVAKGTRTGTMTNLDGSFSIKVQSGTTLLISALGFEDQQVVASSSNLMVQMAPDVKSLSEVVVTGVGAATSKKKVAIAVETVNLANQVKVSSGDVGQQLVGQVAGAQITSTNGNPGQPLNILLRGVNTIQGGTFPMILMDGLQVGATDLNTIDVNIIERVEVVQGAAAASLYGAQGANGVIQLFTKKGKAGRLNIDVSSSATSTELLNVGKVHKADRHAFVTDASGNVIQSSGAPLNFDPVLGTYDANVQYNSLSATSYAEKAYNANLKYYDHYKMFFQKGYVLNNSVTVSGTRERVDFLLSASFNKQNANFKKLGDYTRSNLTGKLGIELAKNLKLTSLTQLIYTRNTLNEQSGRSILFALNNTRPFANYDYRDPDGNYGVYFGDAAGVNGYNPNYENQYSSTLINKLDVIQSFDLNYRFPKFVELDAKYSLNYRAENTTYRYEDQVGNKNAIYHDYFFSNYNPNATPASTGEIDNYFERTTFQNFIGTATVRTDFEKDFRIKLPIRTTTTLAFDYRKNYYRTFSAYGYDAPGYYPWNAAQAGVYKVISDYEEPFVTYGFLANQRFEYGDIAGLSVGVRSDYSSAFGSGANAQTFPRGDAFLNISGFKFWQQSSISNVLHTLKLRAAYGEAGIQPGAFQRFPVLSATNLGQTSVYTFPITSPNPKLAVELSKETELGVDLGINLLKGSWLRNANLSFTYWKRNTDNAIYRVDAAPSTGVGSILNNAFGLGSRGVQASLSLNMLTTRDFTWDMTTNFSKQTSEITSISGPDVVVTSAAGSTGLTLKAGQKIGQLFGFLILKSVDQIEPRTGQPVIPKASQGNYEIASNGWVVDKTTKRPVNTASQYSFGDPNPNFNMSFINNLSYKGMIGLSMQWDWVKGSHLYNQTKEWMYRDGISGDYAIPITVNGETHAYTAFYRGIYQAGANNGTKDYFYEDASFMRLRNISASLDFAKLFHIKGVQKLQLVLSGRNLVTFTKYTGMDPEVSSGASNSTFDRGVDHNTIPNTRAYTVGLNVGF
ncbi:SusC/RagA family TonB-linked outer membrane protein [Sediminibacterium soli]|uniref:SusC/RagA family TonB-linked outer membrane protein n=1 Tax=Sediminibacterium soli TaxID=2698829 RepID=UPI0013798E8A|nr:SusC/RagA family TonB-linked outer membrane protein [Sediminibacterium soli]NCI45359.1 SusC/RagA family TonB-linked outer membrane protein [Sediminibacterium soli]